MTRIDDDWITRSGTVRVMAMLTEAGHAAYFVGGCVRNALLGAPVSDIDIATEARPESVMNAAKGAGFTPVPTGIDHGTVTVVSEGDAYEVTTFRRDIETDGRRAVVSFGTDITEDAQRRDFTLNALYALPDGTVVDPLGGLDDLAARRIRFIGDAAQRIREDYLRILRYFRFHAWYGDTALGFDPMALAAIAGGLDGLDGLSRERVGSEMRKLLAAPDPAPELGVMAQLGVLNRILPGADTTTLAPLVHLEQISGIEPRAMRRLAVLGGADVTDRLRLSKADEAWRHKIRRGIGSGQGAAETGYRHGIDLAQDIALARAATLGVPLPDGWQKAIRSGAEAVFPVSAADLMPAYSGPALGQKLAALEAAWIGSGFRLTRDALLAL